MTMKKYLFIATAVVALASCTSDEFTGDKTRGEDTGIAPITFSFDVPAATRAGGAAAATELSNHFIVWGEKSESGGTAVTSSGGKLVFPNYQVNYATSTAYTTTSNTKDWEYVGYTHSSNYQSNIQTCANPTAETPTKANASSAAQTIKYWDYGATNYVFTAVSAKSETSSSVDDIESGYIKIAKTTAGTTAYDKGYTIDVTANADLSKLYIADREVISQGSGTDRTAPNAYGGNVTLTFRNVLSQIRVGMYETIPGYEISAISFKVTSDVAAKDGSNDAFGAICPNIKASGYAGTLTVTYGNGTTYIQNHPIISASGTAAADLILGTNINAISDASPLGTSAASPTWDTSGGTYTSVFPQINNATNMKVKVSYTLHNDISGETITVTDATAEIPAEYLQWKPNYKYTYLFKISENTNGSSGQGVTGLYPITFDAVEVVAEDGKAEYITTVSEPSITTFGVTSSGAYSVGKDEYETGTDIYATIVQSNAVVSPTGKYNVYTVTAGATEAQVAEAIAEHAIRGVTPTITCTAYTTNVSVVTTVPSEDGRTKAVTGAIKLQSPAANTYAIAYQASAGSATATTASYDASTTYYSMEPDATGFYPIATPTTEIRAWDTSKSSFTTNPTQPVYVYKVIKVVTSGS